MVWFRRGRNLYSDPFFIPKRPQLPPKGLNYVVTEQREIDTYYDGQA